MERQYSLSVQNPIHNILEKGLQTRKPKLEAGISGDGEAENQDASDDGGDGNRPLSANIFEIDRVVGDQGSRDPYDGSDGVITIHDAW